MRFTLTEPSNLETDGFTSENDIFGYSEFGERLADVVSNISTPMVITLDAPWGSGKSVFIKQWAGLIKKRGGSIVYFDAFENDFHDDAFLVLASKIHSLARETLDKEDDHFAERFFDAAKEAGKVLTPIGLDIGMRAATAGLLGLKDSEALKNAFKVLTNETEKAISEKLQKVGEKQELLESFRKALKKMAQAVAEKKEEAGQPPPLVFIVDELDRCRPPFALDIIEHVKHLFFVPNVCFVFVTNLPHLEKTIQGAYGVEFDAHTYLEKFYHFKVMLPEPNYEHQNQREKYLIHLWQGLKPDFGKYPHARFVYDEILGLANAHMLSLRQMERALTNLVLATAAAKGNLLFDPAVIAGLCIMRQTHPDLYKHARRNNLDWKDAEKFLKAANDKEREWVVGCWQYFVDPNAPQEIIERHSQGRHNYFLRSGRLSSLGVFTDYIDNLVADYSNK